MSFAEKLNNIQPISKFAQIGGLRLHYLQQGSLGDPILFLHGFPEYSGAWTPYLQDLSADFYTVAPDLRGYNLSDSPPNVADYRIDLLIADLVGLMDHLGFKKFHVVAHDWGGILGWHLAARHPNRVLGMVIMNAPHPILYQKLYQSDPEQQQMARYIGMLVPEGSEEMYQKDDYKQLRAAFGKAFPLSFSEDQWTGYLQTWRRGLKGPINYYRANIDALSLQEKKLSAITVPTLVLWGEKDTALSIKNLDGLEALVPNVEIKRYSHAGHFINHEMSHIMINEIRKFCTKKSI